jgi:hypothetical protein
VYVIGGVTERRVTLLSQQTRALNVVAALECVHGSALRRMRIAIVGAGAAGMAAATALRGVRVGTVRVFDEAAAPMHAQRASFTRFLHPGLFHWPEAGWDKEFADLPLGRWRAGYADDVRAEILQTCGGADVQFCTTVQDITAAGEGVRVWLLRLGERVPTGERFDIVLVAAGFPAERAPNGADGGSYWHQVEGLEEKTGDVHIIGDGDGALTEVLMLFIALLGHRAVTELARLLPDTAELRRLDLEAQGRPREHAETPRDAASQDLLQLLDELDPRTRRVTIHAPHALKGGSFLLNRVLVEHLLWMCGSSLKVRSESVDRTQLSALGGTVVWRAGLSGARAPRPFEHPALSTQAALAALDHASLDAAASGALVQAVDALRRPLWSGDYARLVSVAAQRWVDRGPVHPVPVAAAMTPECEAALLEITATAIELSTLGLELRPDAMRGSLVSIETVVRVLSIPHVECLHSGAAQDGRVFRDALGRIWFDADARGAVPSRRAVHALVDPGGLRTWADRAPKTWERNQQRWLDEKRGVQTTTLQGLTDLSTVDSSVLKTTWNAHFARSEYQDAVRALLRRARVPGGPSANQYAVGERTRRALIDAARVLAVAGAVPPFKRDDLWTLLTAAAADLVVPSSGGALQLFAGTRFLTRHWAPGVRSLDAAAPPSWFDPLARHARDIPTPARLRDGDRFDRDALLTLATATLRNPATDRRPLAHFGVAIPDAAGRH